MQVLSTTKTDSFASSSINGNTGVDITGLSVDITPSATSSKILIIFNVNGSFSYSTRQGSCGVRLLRDSTFIWLSLSVQRMYSLLELYIPSTTAFV